MSYDKIYGEGGIEYGIKFGSDTVVFLKTGKGATIYGENDEQSTLYLDLAEKIFQEFGYTVFVANNPLECDIEDPLIKDEGILKQIFPNIKGIIYVGYSSGANFGAWYGGGYEKMLLINPILNMNFHKLQRTCEQVGERKIVIALGEGDPSSRYCFMIPKRNNVKTVILKGQSHHINSDFFIGTVVEFLLNKGVK